MEGIPDRVLDVGERFSRRELCLRLHQPSHLLHDAVFALEAVIEAHQLAVRVLGLDGAVAVGLYSPVHDASGFDRNALA